MGYLSSRDPPERKYTPTITHSEHTSSSVAKDVNYITRTTGAVAVVKLIKLPAPV